MQVQADSQTAATGRQGPLCGPMPLGVPVEHCCWWPQSPVAPPRPPPPLPQAHTSNTDNPCGGEGGIAEVLSGGWGAGGLGIRRVSVGDHRAE